MLMLNTGIGLVSRVEDFSFPFDSNSHHTNKWNWHRIIANITNNLPIFLWYLGKCQPLYLIMKKLRKHLIYLLFNYTIVGRSQGLSHIRPVSTAERDVQPNITNGCRCWFSLTWQHMQRVTFYILFYFYEI